MPTHYPCIGLQAYRSQSWLQMLKYPMNKLQPLSAVVWELLEISLLNVIRLQILEGPVTGLPYILAEACEQSSGIGTQQELLPSMPSKILKGPYIYLPFPHSHNLPAVQLAVDTGIRHESLMSVLQEILKWLYTQLLSLQLWLGSSQAYPGTWQETHLSVSSELGIQILVLAVGSEAVQELGYGPSHHDLGLILFSRDPSSDWQELCYGSGGTHPSTHLVIGPLSEGRTVQTFSTVPSY